MKPVCVGRNRQRGRAADAIRLIKAGITKATSALALVARVSQEFQGQAEGKQSNRCDGMLEADRDREMGDYDDDEDEEEHADGTKLNWRRALTVERDARASRVIALGTLGDIYLSLGRVWDARALYSACRRLVERKGPEILVTEEEPLVGAVISHGEEEGGVEDVLRLLNLASWWRGGERWLLERQDEGPPEVEGDGDRDEAESEQGRGYAGRQGTVDRGVAMSGRCLAALVACLGDAHLRLHACMNT